MSVDKEKVNRILRKIQDILKAEKPNLQELISIQSKIDSMVQSNINKQYKKKKIMEERQKSEVANSEDTWFKVDIE